MKVVVLRMSEDTSCVRFTECTALYKAGRDNHARVNVHNISLSRSTFFDVSQQCSSVFTHVFVISSVDISTHNSEMLMSVLLQN